MKTITQVRAAFWESHPEILHHKRSKKRQNDYNTNIRCLFVDFVDNLHKNGQISDKLAFKVTL